MSNEMDAMAGGPGSGAENDADNVSKKDAIPQAAPTGAVAGPNPTPAAPIAAVPTQQTAPRKQLKSKKLDRTLQELESAFTNWESLNEVKADATASAVEPEAKKPKEATAAEEEFRKKTRMLLHQLRQQLADFSND